MTKLNNFLILFILIFYSSACGYNPIYSKKDIHFNINNIEFIGDRAIAQKVNEKLFSYKNKPDKKRQVNLVFNSKKNIIIASKNDKGEAKSCKIEIKIEMKATFENKNFIEKTFVKTATYNAIDRISKLKSLENRLTSDLSSQITDEIILTLLEK